MNEDFTGLIEYCCEKERGCPKPHYWNVLWEMLPKHSRIGGRWEPPVPLILAAWGYTTNLEKMDRLTEHICWADKHGKLFEVDNYLRNIQETDWHHLSD